MYSVQACLERRRGIAEPLRKCRRLGHEDAENISKVGTTDPPVLEPNNDYRKNSEDGLNAATTSSFGRIDEDDNVFPTVIHTGLSSNSDYIYWALAEPIVVDLTAPSPPVPAVVLSSVGSHLFRRDSSDDGGSPPPVFNTFLPSHSHSGQLALSEAGSSAAVLSTLEQSTLEDGEHVSLVLISIDDDIPEAICWTG